MCINMDLFPAVILAKLDDFLLLLTATIFLFALFNVTNCYELSSCKVSYGSTIQNKINVS